MGLFGNKYDTFEKRKKEWDKFIEKKEHILGKHFLYLLFNDYDVMSTDHTYKGIASDFVRRYMDQHLPEEYHHDFLEYLKEKYQEKVQKENRIEEGMASTFGTK